MSANVRARLSLAALSIPLVLALAPLAAAQTSAPPGGPAAPAARTLYLVRHGAYDEDDPRDESVGQGLTDLGREQARLVGSRLAGLGVRFDAVWSSPLTRARETAQIVAQVLPGAQVQTAPELAECRPPSSRDAPGVVRASAADSCLARLESAYARFFRPAQGSERQEVLVCHGNVIRWLWCRALGVDPAAWLGMTIANCSLTVIRVGPDGSCKLYAFDDTGHLPLAVQGYAGVPPPWRPAAAGPAPR